jgi:hypothetical protein
MSPSAWRKLVFGVVIVGLAGYGLSLLRGGPESAAAQASSSGVLPDSSGGGPLKAALAPLSAEHQRQRQMLAAAEWPTDPFWRPGEVEVPQPVRPEPGAPGQDRPLALTGVISGGVPLAMINGRVVAIGEQVSDGVVVTAIDDNSVTLQTPEGQKTLTLSE